MHGETMPRYLGWKEDADLILKGVDSAIAAREVTYDFHRLMESEGAKAKHLRCSQFGEAVVSHMG